MSERKKSSVVIEFLITAILILFIVFILLTYFMFKSSDCSPKLFDYYIFRTHASNMETVIPSGSAVFCSVSEVSTVRENSIVLCKIDNTVTLIRIVAQLQEDDGLFYIVRYETSPEIDTYKIPAESVIGKAVSLDTNLGKFLDLAVSPTGIILFVIIPGVIIVLFQILRIVRTGNNKSEYDQYEDEEEENDPEYEFSKRQSVLRASFAEKDKKEDNILYIDKHGKADFAKREDINSSDNVLMTSEKLDGFFNEVMSEDNGTEFKPVKIEEEKNENDYLSSFSKENKLDEKQSTVIPEEISAIRTPVSTFTDDKPAKRPKMRKPETDFDVPKLDPELFVKNKNKAETITDNAVTDDMETVKVPEESKKIENQFSNAIENQNTKPPLAIAPAGSISPRRKRTDPTIDELLSFIDKNS